MNKKKLSLLRSTGLFIRNWIIKIAISLIIGGWVVISGLNLFCVVTMTCNSTTLTWWNMFIQVLGFPVLAVQLYLLRKTIEEGTWKPKLSIGLMKNPLSPNEIMKSNELPKEVTWGFSDFLDPIKRITKEVEEGYQVSGDRTLELVMRSHPSLIIRNKGKATARSLKIQITLVNFPDQPIIPIIKLMEIKNKPDANFISLDLVSIIHPEDFASFALSVSPEPSKNDEGEMSELITKSDDYLDTSMKYYGNVDRSQYPHRYNEDKSEEVSVKLAKQFLDFLYMGRYVFNVIVWADGIKPVTEKVVVNLQGFSDDFIRLIHEIVAEFEKYYKDNEDHSYKPSFI